ncbi:MAG: hypothetical protein JWO91_2214 [Acidobacteriaceae bacterium]|nr:hypothetical protein [Acidobacteriaceae bacterium]
MENSRVFSRFTVASNYLGAMSNVHISAFSVSVGTCLSLFASGVITALFRSRSVKAFVPLIFLLLIFLVARKFGSLAAALGTLVSAGTFALYLFAPFHSLLVDDPIARRNLMWMVLFGLIVAHFIPPTSNKRSNENVSL